MSKALTEQWRKGNLQETYYYTKSPWSEGEVDISYVHNGVDDWEEIIEPVPSYEKWRTLIDGDKGTLEHLKKILPMIEHNRVAYDYLEKVIEDMEKDIEEIDNG